MDTLFIVLTIIGLIFGILQIILFFKIWGMTNDVKKIKEEFLKREFDKWKSDN